MRRPRPLTVVAVLAVVLFALWGIGGPLFGTSVLASTDEMVAHSPYAEAGHAGSLTTNTYLDDINTALLPDMILFRDALADGELAAWDPYVSGGSAVASVPTAALFNPLSVPYWLLPAWLAPGYVLLLQTIVAVGGCLLFLRRLGLSRAAAVTGGLVFAGSAFMVAWLNFPQTRVAAFIPALFWTLERLVQQRRARDAALVAVPVAAMLLGGFPAVTGFALLTAACYVAVRAVADNLARLRRAITTLVGAGLGVAGGVGLAMFQLVPFVDFYRRYLIEGRGQLPTFHLDPASLVTAVAPFALGTVNPHSPPAFVLERNFVESVSYIGAGAAVLVLIAVAAMRRGRALLPRGAWAFLVAATLAWVVLIYAGGPPLAAAQQTPGLDILFGGNFIGRSRSVLGFLLAALAAVGMELLLRSRRAAPAGARRAVSVDRLWAAGTWAAAAVVAGYVLLRAHRAVAGAELSRRLRPGSVTNR
ncbi:MAG TPA: hypothetical protein VHN18_08365, partial [Micromonosporaceae bacterium]|nr:hypothetical protein [Micromonosporaceae bacterium]